MASRFVIRDSKVPFVIVFRKLDFDWSKTDQWRFEVNGGQILDPRPRLPFRQTSPEISQRLGFDVLLTLRTYKQASNQPDNLCLQDSSLRERE